MASKMKRSKYKGYPIELQMDGRYDVFDSVPDGDVIAEDFKTRSLAEAWVAELLHDM